MTILYFFFQQVVDTIICLQCFIHRITKSIDSVQNSICDSIKQLLVAPAFSLSFNLFERIWRSRKQKWTVQRVILVYGYEMKTLFSTWYISKGKSVNEECDGFICLIPHRHNHFHVDVCHDMLGRYFHLMTCRGWKYNMFIQNWIIIAKQERKTNNNSSNTIFHSNNRWTLAVERRFTAG